MATPRADSYTAASGAKIYAGCSAGYDWASQLVANSFTELAGTSFAPWATANIPPGAYQGSDPFASIVNAFCDPGYDPAGASQYFFGGGHSDGTCNGVFKFSHSTLAWSMAFAPTPPSKYPPSYYNGGNNQPGPLIYPSGFNGANYFQDTLTDPLDVSYNTTYARCSSHMYAAAAVRGTKIYYFYGWYGVFDFGAGAWERSVVDIGAQIYAINPNYSNQQLQQGTVAIYDDVTDRFFVTLVSGDAGLNWRSSIITFNPNSSSIDSITDMGDVTFGFIVDSVNLCKVGRLIYVFTKVAGSAGTNVMNQGLIFNMDTRAVERFSIVGDTAGTVFTPNPTQETIPSYYDGIAIRRWNFQSTEKANIYSLNLTPESGSGTIGNPYILRQTRIVLSGSVPVSPLFIYSRLVWNSAAQCALVIPRNNENFVAIKLA